MFAPTQSSVPATYPANPLKPSDYLHAQSYRPELKEWLAGMVGFEPTIYCTKNSCPTARPHPKTGTLIKAMRSDVQDLNFTKFHLIDDRCICLASEISDHAFTSTKIAPVRAPFSTHTCASAVSDSEKTC